MPSVPELYWHRQFWPPSAYRDSTGISADLSRRLPSRMLRLSWRLHVDVRIRAVVIAPDDQAARAARQAALHHRIDVIAVSRADVDAVPPRCPLGTATHVEIYTTSSWPPGPDTWLHAAGMLAGFTVDVTDATWPA